MDNIAFPEDMFEGEDGHPQCCFFEALPSSADPYETFYGEFFCYMSGKKANMLKFVREII